MDPGFTFSRSASASVRGACTRDRRGAVSVRSSGTMIDSVSEPSLLMKPPRPSTPIATRKKTVSPTALFHQTPRRGDRRRATTTLLLLLIAAPCQLASAQPQSGTATGQSAATDSTDKTGTNPANLLDTVEVSNAFFSHGDGLFTDQVTWSYRQAFSNHRVRARVDLPLVFANVTGRTEAGFGDVGLGGEWLAAARTSTAFVAGVDLAVNSSTNEALAEGHHSVETIGNIRRGSRLTDRPFSDSPGASRRHSWCQDRPSRRLRWTCVG